MKKRIILLLLAGMALGSCKKECTLNNSTCKDFPPTGELCTASFSRWFYDQESNSCEQIGYSGCSVRGFATQQECEQCACD